MARTLRVKNLRDIPARRKLGAKVKLCGHNTAFRGRIGVMQVSLPPFGRLKEHRHEESESLLLILRGEGKLIHSERRKEVMVYPEDLINIPPRTWHCLEASDKGLEYLSVQEPPIQFHGRILDTTLRSAVAARQPATATSRQPSKAVA